MSGRFHYFSHIEHLPSGRLVLIDPFRIPFDEGSVCRYGPRLPGPAVLEPDPRFQGVAAYHALLPLEPDQLPQAEPILKIHPWAHRLAGHLRDLSRVRFSPTLPFVISLAKAREVQLSEVHCLSPGWDARAFLDTLAAEGPLRRLFLPASRAIDQRNVEFFEGSIQSRRDMFPHPAPNTGDLSPWGNPFRLEGLKLIGLELANRFRGRTPALLVHDFSGELLFALLTASSHCRLLRPKTLPYRLILVQEQPFDGLCRTFEGGTPDWSPLLLPENTRYLKPPESVLAPLVRGLTEHLGGAVALEPVHRREYPPESIFEAALERLIRAGFLDEEDEVLTLGGPDSG